MSIRTGLTTSFLALILLACGGQTAPDAEKKSESSPAKSEAAKENPKGAAASDAPLGELLAKVEDIEIGSNAVVFARQKERD